MDSADSPASAPGGPVWTAGPDTTSIPPLDTPRAQELLRELLCDGRMFGEFMQGPLMSINSSDLLAAPMCRIPPPPSIPPAHTLIPTSPPWADNAPERQPLAITESTILDHHRRIGELQKQAGESTQQLLQTRREIQHMDKHTKELEESLEVADRQLSEAHAMGVDWLYLDGLPAYTSLKDEANHWQQLAEKHASLPGEVERAEHLLYQQVMNHVVKGTKGGEKSKETGETERKTETQRHEFDRYLEQLFASVEPESENEPVATYSPQVALPASQGPHIPAPDDWDLSFLDTDDQTQDTLNSADEADLEMINAISGHSQTDNTRNFTSQFYDNLGLIYSPSQLPTSDDGGVSHTDVIATHTDSPQQPTAAPTSTEPRQRQSDEAVDALVHSLLRSASDSSDDVMTANTVLSESAVDATGAERNDMKNTVNTQGSINTEMVSTDAESNDMQNTENTVSVESSINSSISRDVRVDHSIPETVAAEVVDPGTIHSEEHLSVRHVDDYVWDNMELNPLNVTESVPLVTDEEFLSALDGAERLLNQEDRLHRMTEEEEELLQQLDSQSSFHTDSLSTGAVRSADLSPGLVENTHAQSNDEEHQSFFEDTIVEMVAAAADGMSFEEEFVPNVTQEEFIQFLDGEERLVDILDTYGARFDDIYDHIADITHNQLNNNNIITTAQVHYVNEVNDDHGLHQVDDDIQHLFAEEPSDAEEGGDATNASNQATAAANDFINWIIQNVPIVADNQPNDASVSTVNTATAHVQADDIHVSDQVQRNALLPANDPDIDYESDKDEGDTTPRQESHYEQIRDVTTRFITLTSSTSDDSSTSLSESEYVECIPYTSDSDVSDTTTIRRDDSSDDSYDNKSILSKVKVKKQRAIICQPEVAIIGDGVGIIGLEDDDEEPIYCCGCRWL